MVLVVTGKKVTFLVVTQKNALVLVVILLLVVTEISLRRKKAYVVVTPMSFVNIIFMVVITPSPGMVVTNRTDLARQSYLVSQIAQKSTVLSAKGIK